MWGYENWGIFWREEISRDAFPLKTSILIIIADAIKEKREAIIVKKGENKNVRIASCKEYLACWAAIKVEIVAKRAKDKIYREEEEIWIEQKKDKIKIRIIIKSSKIKMELIIKK